MATHVVRTKAIKCTKVVVSNDPSPCLAHNVDHFDPDKHTSPSSLDAHHLSECYPVLLEANTLNGLSPSSFSTTTTTTSQEAFSSSTDFIMNFNSTEELFLSNLLNSDLFDYNDKYRNNRVLSTSLGDDQALMFSEDFLTPSWEYY
ncbi:hypothetical protein FEM48_Zijuj08G0018000 [Ziziphus jujuba var. spinosa]|nr:hypothetical protein FEM48_Zijuj08G0018000 [Ziziphus jujuba var. spinosa]